MPDKIFPAFCSDRAVNLSFKFSICCLVSSLISEIVCWILSKFPPKFVEILSLISSILAEAFSIPDKILPAFCSDRVVNLSLKFSICCLVSSLISETVC